MTEQRLFNFRANKWYRSENPQAMCVFVSPVLNPSWCINTTLSGRLPVASGVPQGSILGPLLFNIYVNDLPLVPEHCAPQCYVDDTKLLMSFHLQDQSSVMDKMNKDLLKIRNWCFYNQLLLNPDKTKLVIFGSRQMATKVEDFRLSLLGKELVPVKIVKDLGIILDSNLTYNEHIITTVSACMKRLGQINRVKLWPTYIDYNY